MDTVYAGAFELNGISGVCLARGADVLGFRMAFPHVSLGLFDGNEIVLSVSRPPVTAADGRYAQYAWRVPVTPAGIRRFATFPRLAVNGPVVCDYEPGEATEIVLEWTFDGQQVRGRYRADAEVRAALLVNGCFAPAGVDSLDDGAAVLSMGNSRLLVNLHGTTERPLCVDSREDAERALLGCSAPDGGAIGIVSLELSPETPLYFAAWLTAAADDKALLPDVQPEAIDTALERESEHYAQQRMTGEGALAGAPEALGSLIGYSRTYDPQRRCLQTTVNRTWGGPNQPGLVFGWDNFFDSYIAAWEDPELGAASLEHVVRTYGENGIANGPVQRNLINPVTYCRTLDLLGDAELAERTWDTMMDYLRFWFADRGDGVAWRDGNGDGLIESGARDTGANPGRIIQEAMDETGYDEIPIYSAGFTNRRRGLLANGVNFDWPSNCLTITLVGQNSLYCASCKAMTRWAERLGHDTDAAWLRGEAERVAEAMHDRLLEPLEGLFRDRLWSGEFSPVKTPTMFYPLLAGIANDKIKSRLRQLLLNPETFWGDNVVPTVSRDDPAYCDGLDGRGNYWRGNIWPPMTYITYLAIKEAGWDDVAAQFAERAARQFMGYWERYTHAYENYPPEGDVNREFLYLHSWGGREMRYVWSGLMLLCGLEEVFAPEVDLKGWRFGNPHLSETTAWRKFRCAGEFVEAQAGPDITSVRFGDHWAFEARPGVAIREFQHAGEDFSLPATTPVDVRASLRDPALGPGTGIRFDRFPCMPERAEPGVVEFVIPAGTHHISAR